MRNRVCIVSQKELVGLIFSFDLFRINLYKAVVTFTDDFYSGKWRLGIFRLILTEYFLTKLMDQRSDKMLIPSREKLEFSNKTYKCIKKGLGWIII